MLILTIYDFEMFHKLEKANFVDKLSRYLDYEKTSMLNIKFLLLLQNKLALSKNMRNFLKIFNNVFKIINVQKFKFV